MLSDVIKHALEEKVAGQTAAVNSVVRGVTRAIAGLVPREGPACAYMFVGPSGTGKTHLVRTLARTMHGDERRLVVADCTHAAMGDSWTSFATQLVPLFTVPRMDNGGALIETAPLSILMVEYLERGRPELAKAMAAALETGRLMLPQGRQGSLRNCLVFITTSLCSREILDESPAIGFAAQQDDSEQERLYRTCFEAAEQAFGFDLVGRLDGLIIFHRLQEEQLSEILESLTASLNQVLATRGFRCELMPAAKTFLLEKGRGNLRLGARDLVRAHRRFVHFPVADLMVSQRIPNGGLVRVDRRPGQDHLHFTVKHDGVGSEAPEPDLTPHEIPVAWEEDTKVH